MQAKQPDGWKWLGLVFSVAWDQSGSWDGHHGAGRSVCGVSLFRNLPRTNSVGVSYHYLVGYLSQVLFTWFLNPPGKHSKMIPRPRGEGVGLGGW